MIATALGTIAAVFGVTMALSPLLQVRRMLATRSSRDVSVAYLGVMTAGFVIWVAYGWSIVNPFIIVPNSVALVVYALTTGLAVQLARGQTSS